MKKFLTAFLICVSSIKCNKPPYPAPQDPERIWVDKATRSDTIITNVGNMQFHLYYAEKNWQSSPDSNLIHGYRQIAIRFHGDSILVKPFGDPTTNYSGPFLLQMSNDKTTLAAQNFIGSSQPNAARIFIPE